MKAYLIKPDHVAHRAEIQVVDIRHDADGDASLDHVCELLECQYMQAVNGVGALSGHSLYCDEDGLFKKPPGFLYLAGIHPAPFAGNLLIVGKKTHPELGIVASAATVSIEAVEILCQCSYSTPRYAHAAHRLQEQKVRITNPDVIVVCGSDLIDYEGKNTT
jgi:translation initiation factor IF-1